MKFNSRVLEVIDRVAPRAESARMWVIQIKLIG